MLYRNEYNRMTNANPQPQGRSFSFTSSSVTYGGVNGAYYTSSTTRRAGSDGVSNNLGYREHYREGLCCSFLLCIR